MFTYKSKLATFFLWYGSDLPGHAPPQPPVETAPPCLLQEGEAATCGPGPGLNITAPPRPPPVPEPSDFALQVEYIGYVYVMPVMCGLDVVLNLLTVLVFCRHLQRAPIYTYLSALAMADITTGLFTMPIGMSRCGSCATVDYPKLFYEIYIYMPLTNMSETASAWLVVVLAVERLLSVKLPMLDKTTSRARRRSYAVLALLTLSTIALNIPYFFILDIGYPGPEAHKTLFGSSEGFIVYSWVRASLVQFGPLLVLVVLNCLLVREVRESRARYRRISVASRASLRMKAQIRLNLMLIGTVVLFIVGNVPVAFSYSVIFAEVFGEESLRGDFYSVWRVITHLLAVLSYALDFVVYCAVNRHFRDTCADVLSCHRNKRKISDFTPSSNKEIFTPTKF